MRVKNDLVASTTRMETLLRNQVNVQVFFENQRRQAYVFRGAERHWHLSDIKPIKAFTFAREEDNFRFHLRFMLVQNASNHIHGWKGVSLIDISLESRFNGVLSDHTAQMMAINNERYERHGNTQ